MHISKQKLLTKQKLRMPSREYAAVLLLCATPTQPVFLIRVAEAFPVVVPSAVEVELLGLPLSLQEHCPSSTVGLHVAPHFHRLTTCASGSQQRRDKCECNH